MSQQLPDGSPSSRRDGDWFASRPDGSPFKDYEPPSVSGSAGGPGRRPGKLTPRSVRLLSEYGAESPIWTLDGPVSPEDVGLSARLSADLLAWQDHFEQHFHHEDGWDSLASRDWYADRSKPLREAVARELGESVELTVSLWPLE